MLHLHEIEEKIQQLEGKVYFLESFIEMMSSKLKLSPDVNLNALDPENVEYPLFIYEYAFENYPHYYTKPDAREFLQRTKFLPREFTNKHFLKDELTVAEKELLNDLYKHNQYFFEIVDFLSEKITKHIPNFDVMRRYY